MLLAKLLYKPTFCSLQIGFATLGPFVRPQPLPNCKMIPLTVTQLITPWFMEQEPGRGQHTVWGKKDQTPNPSTEVTFIRFTHFIAALSVLLEEAGKMCLFRRKMHYLYLSVCFIIQQPMASALFKDWHSPREQHLGTDASREGH